MPIDDEDLFDAPRPKPSNKIVYQPPGAQWSLDRLGEVESLYQTSFKKKLPLINRGQGSIHNKWGYDHRNSADVSINPSTPEGQRFIEELKKANVPFLAFSGAIPGVATGPHVHIGFPSARTQKKFGIGAQKKSKTVASDDLFDTDDDLFDQGSEQIPPSSSVVSTKTSVSPVKSKGQSSAPLSPLERALGRMPRAQRQRVREAAEQKPARASDPARLFRQLGQQRTIDQLQREQENQVRDQVREEIRGRTGPYGNPTGTGILHLLANPVSSFTGLLKSEDEKVAEETGERIKAQRLAETPEVTEIRKEYGAMPAAERAVVAPLARGGAGLLSTAGGIASAFGIAPNRLSEWANKRAAIIEAGAGNAPLREKRGLSSLITGQTELEEVQRGVPEKIATGFADLGVGLGQIILLQKATKLPFNQLLALEAAAKNNDKPIEQQLGHAAEGYALGSALQSHLGKGANAALFGIPTAAQTGYEVAQGRMSPLDAAIQTGIQAGAGAILTPKKESPLNARLRDIAATEAQAPPPRISFRERMAQRGTQTKVQPPVEAQREKIESGPITPRRALAHQTIADLAENATAQHEQGIQTALSDIVNKPADWAKPVRQVNPKQLTEGVDEASRVEANLREAGADVRDEPHGHMITPWGKGIGPTTKRGIMNHWEVAIDAGYLPESARTHPPASPTAILNGLLEKGWLRWKGEGQWESWGLSSKDAATIEDDLAMVKQPNKTIYIDDAKNGRSYSFKIQDFIDNDFNLRDTLKRAEKSDYEPTPPYRLGEPNSTARPQRFYHKDWGEVEVLEDQSGARPGRVKVAEVADPTKQHFPRRSDLAGRGNQRMVPVKLEPSLEPTISPEAPPKEALRQNEINLESGIVEAPKAAKPSTESAGTDRATWNKTYNEFRQQGLSQADARAKTISKLNLFLPKELTDRYEAMRGKTDEFGRGFDVDESIAAFQEGKSSLADTKEWLETIEEYSTRPKTITDTVTPPSPLEQGVEAPTKPASESVKPIEVGEYVNYTEPVIQYKNGEPFTASKRVRARVTSIKANGDLEVKAVNGGYAIKNPSEVTRPTGNAIPATVGQPSEPTTPAGEAEGIRQTSEAVGNKNASGSGAEKHFLFLERGGRRVPVAGPFPDQAAAENASRDVRRRLQERDPRTHFDSLVYGRTSDPQAIESYASHIREKFPPEPSVPVSGAPKPAKPTPLVSERGRRYQEALGRTEEPTKPSWRESEQRTSEFDKAAERDFNRAQKEVERIRVERAKAKPSATGFSAEQMATDKALLKKQIEQEEIVRLARRYAKLPQALSTEAPKPTEPTAGQRIRVSTVGDKGGFELEVKGEKEGKVEIGYPDSEHVATRIPKESFRQFVDDLEGRVDVPANSGRPEIDAVASGKAEFLGKGDDGLAFRVGDKVVKVSTVVPYIPTNPGVRTPAQAVENLRRQVEITKEAIKAGVPGLLPSEFVEHGGKGFEIRPYLQMPEKMSARQLGNLRHVIEQMNEKGFTNHDQLQAGLLKGDVYLSDTGKLARLSDNPTQRRYDIEDDSRHFQNFAERMGQKNPLPTKELARQQFDTWREGAGLLLGKESRSYGDLRRRALIASGEDPRLINEQFNEAIKKHKESRREREAKKIERLPTGDRADEPIEKFVRRNGGWNWSDEFRGELKRIQKSAPYLFSNKNRQGSQGVSVEVMMDRANEAGFRDPNTGQPFEHPGDFIYAVERSLMGDKLFSSHRETGLSDAEFARQEAEYYAEREAIERAEGNRVELLESGRGAELLDKIHGKQATNAELEEFRTLAREHGLSELEVEDLIAGDAEAFGDLEAASSQRSAAPPARAEQLGFVQEGLTQESAPPPKVPDQRARLAREEQDRQAALNPERAAAQAKLEEIRRRGMTVEDYARQPDLTGNVPDPKELRLLRELERTPEPEPSQQRRLGEEGFLNVSPEKVEYKPATTPVLKDVERATMEGENKRPSLRQFARRAASYHTRALIAEFTPLRELEATLYGKDKVPVVNLARKFEQVAGAPAKAQADIIDFRRAVIDPIRKSADDFNSFLFLKRVEDRLLKEPDRKRVADWTIEKAQQGLAELKAKVGDETYKQLERAGDAYQKEMDKALRLQVESGRMSDELYEQIINSRDFYAPFKVLRHIEESDILKGSGRRVATTQELSKKIVGIDKEDFQLGNILQASAEQIVRSRILAEKNLKMLELDKLADLDPKGDLIRRVEGDERPRQGYEYVRFLKDGKPVALEVQHVVANAVQGLNPKQASLLAQAMAMARKPLQLGATSANAGFQAVNLFFADLPRQALVSRYGVRSPKDIYQFPLDWTYSLMTSMKGNFGRPNKLYMDWLRSGAANSTVQRELTPESFRPTLGIAKPGIKHLGRSVIDSVAKFSNAIEETSKILGLKRGMKAEEIAKMSPAERQQAMEKIAVEVRNYSGSPDFARKGSETRELNLLFMFFNARLQGLASDMTRLAGRTGTKEAVTAWARLGTVIGIPTTLLAILNNSPQYKDDYDKIPDWEKKSYWMIPRESYFKNEDTGETVRDYWRIPKRELGQLFGNTIESAVEFGYKHDPKTAKQWGVDMLENISPINIQGKTTGERAESAFSGLNPALKLPAELIMNRDTFRHRDIVPDYMSKAAPAEQYRESTPRPYRAAGRALGVSPLQLEHLTEGATGSAASQFNIRPQPEGRSSLAGYPVFRRFFRSGATAQDDSLTQAQQDAATKQLQRRRERQDALRKYRAGQISKEELDRLEQEDRLTESDVKRVEKEAGMTPRQVAFYNKAPLDALAAYERMTQPQQEHVKDIMARKAYTLLNSKALTDKQKEEFKARIEQLGIYPEAPRRQGSNPFRQRFSTKFK